MTEKNFPKPDANGFFNYESGDVWVHDGDQYVLRASDGTEKLVEAVCEDSAYFIDPDSREMVDDMPPFDNLQFGIKPAGPDDRVVLHVSIPGGVLIEKLAALEVLFPDLG